MALQQTISRGWVNNITPNFRMDNGLWVEFNFNMVANGLGEKFGEKLGEKFGEKLTENRKLIIETMMNNPLTTIAELSEQIGVTTRTIEKNINFLKNNNYIKRIGSDKGGHWEVIPNF